MTIAFTPRTENIRGSDLGGADNAQNRTYTLTNSNAVSSTLKIWRNGVFLHQGSGLDFTFNGTVITFLINIQNTNYITVSYSTSADATAASTNYATTNELAKFMCIEGTVPDRSSVGTVRDLEKVGTGNSSAADFYLDNAYVLADSYTIYKGDKTTAVTALTETTDYTMAKNNGKVSLTSTGKTSLGVSSIYASYSYVNVGLTDDQMQDAVNRAITEVDTRTNNHWADGTDATPDYVQVTDEKQTGRGQFDRTYNTFNRPIPNVSTTISSPLAIGDQTVTVVSTDGFLSSGTVGIETDKIAYTTKTSTEFLGVTGVSATHVSNLDVYPYVVEQSVTPEGTVPTWTVLKKDRDFDLVNATGKVRILFNDVQAGTAFYQTAPLYLAPNRFRTTYFHGNTTIPNDIKKATLMIASRDLMHKAVRKATVGGKNSFNPAMIDVDMAWIDQILSRYRNYRASNV